jgi:hypothetical protein
MFERFPELLKGHTWAPVIPWQMTLVFLLTQTLAVLEKVLCMIFDNIFYALILNI